MDEKVQYNLNTNLGLTAKIEQYAILNLLMLKTCFIGS